MEVIRISARLYELVDFVVWLVEKCENRMIRSCDITTIIRTIFNYLKETEGKKDNIADFMFWLDEENENRMIHRWDFSTIVWAIFRYLDEVDTDES